MRPWAVIMTKKQMIARISGVPNQMAPISIATPAARAASWPTRMTVRVAIRPASRAAIRDVTVMPAAFAAKSIEYARGEIPFIDCSANAEVAT
jgi:hypothetical protein